MHRFTRERLGLPAVLLADGAREVFRESRDIVLPVAQRRQRKRKHEDPVVEILAEVPGRHLFLEIAMRGDDHANIHAHRRAAADALDLALFENAQQLGLHDRRHVADLVEKQRAAMGLLELAGVPQLRRR